MIQKESKEEVLNHFLQLDEPSRWEVLERIAGDEDGEPIDMYVTSTMLMSSDDFREAKQRLIERGYSVDFVNVS